MDGNGKIDLDEFTTLMSGYIQDSEMKEHKQLAELLSKIEGEERLSQVEKLKVSCPSEFMRINFAKQFLDIYLVVVEIHDGIMAVI